MSKTIEQDNVQKTRQREIKNMTFRNQMKLAMKISQNQTKINEEEEYEEEIVLDYDKYFKDKKRKREETMDRNLFMERKVLYKHSLKEFDLIKKNIYINRKKYVLKDEDAYICECISPKIKKGIDLSKLSENEMFGCGNRCSNQLISWDCVPHLCPSGDSCRNRRFQLHQHSEVYPIKTENRGWGLCAGEFLPKGTFVMQYIGEIYNISSSYGKKKIEEYKNKCCTYLMSLSDNEVIDPTFKGNLARFINHSCDPNCLTQKWYVLGEQCIGIFTLRDINEGEELTFNYNFDIYKTTFQKCLCGSINCKGYLGVAKNEGMDRINNSYCRCCKNNVKASDKIIACEGCSKIFHFNCTKKSKFGMIISNKISNVGNLLNFFNANFNLNLINDNDLQNIFICNSCLKKKKILGQPQVALQNAAFSGVEEVPEELKNFSIPINISNDSRIVIGNPIEKNFAIINSNLNNFPSITNNFLTSSAKRSSKIVYDNDGDDMLVDEENPNNTLINKNIKSSASKNTLIRMNLEEIKTANLDKEKMEEKIIQNQKNSMGEIYPSNMEIEDNVVFSVDSSETKEDISGKKIISLEVRKHSLELEENNEANNSNMKNFRSMSFNKNSLGKIINSERKEERLEFSESSKFPGKTFENLNFNNYEDNLNFNRNHSANNLLESFNMNSKITDDDYKSEDDEDDYDESIIDESIEVDSKNLQIIRSNLNSLSSIGARLFWDFRLVSQPKVEIKITGTKLQISKIKVEINKIISNGNHARGEISRVFLVPKIFVRRIIGHQNRNLNTFKSKYNIQIDYDNSLITDEIFHITDLTKMVVKGLEQNLNKVTHEIENYLFNMKIISIHLMNTDYNYVKSNICSLKTSIDPADVRLRKKDPKIDREIKHSFYYIPSNCRDLVMIGFDNEIKKGQRVVRDFLLRQNTLEYNQSLCFLCPTYLMNTINNFKIEVGALMQQKNVFMKIIEPNYTRKHLNLNFEGKWKDIIFIKNCLYRFFSDFYNSSAFLSYNMSHLASLNFIPNKKKSSIYDFHQYIYNQEHKLISKNLRKFFIEKNYLIKNWDYISEELFSNEMTFEKDKKILHNINIAYKKDDINKSADGSTNEKEEESNVNILKMFLKTYDRDTALNYMLNQFPGDYKRFFNMGKIDLCDNLIFYLEEANNSYNHHRKDIDSEKNNINQNVNQTSGNFSNLPNNLGRNNINEENRSFMNDQSELFGSEYEPNNNYFQNYSKNLSGKMIKMSNKSNYFEGEDCNEQFSTSMNLNLNEGFSQDIVKIKDFDKSKIPLNNLDNIEEKQSDDSLIKKYTGNDNQNFKINLNNEKDIEKEREETKKNFLKDIEKQDKNSKTKFDQISSKEFETKDESNSVKNKQKSNFSNHPESIINIYTISPKNEINISKFSAKISSGEKENQLEKINKENINNFNTNNPYIQSQTSQNIYIVRGNSFNSVNSSINEENKGKFNLNNNITELNIENLNSVEISMDKTNLNENFINKISELKMKNKFLNEKNQTENTTNINLPIFPPINSINSIDNQQKNLINSNTLEKEINLRREDNNTLNSSSNQNTLNNLNNTNTFNTNNDMMNILYNFSNINQMNINININSNSNYKDLMQKRETDNFIIGKESGLFKNVENPLLKMFNKRTNFEINETESLLKRKIKSDTNFNMNCYNLSNNDNFENLNLINQNPNTFKQRFENFTNFPNSKMLTGQNLQSFQNIPTLNMSQNGALQQNNSTASKYFNSSNQIKPQKIKNYEKSSKKTEYNKYSSSRKYQISKNSKSSKLNKKFYSRKRLSSSKSKDVASGSSSNHRRGSYSSNSQTQSDDSSYKNRKNQDNTLNNYVYKRMKIKIKNNSKKDKDREREKLKEKDKSKSHSYSSSLNQSYNSDYSGSNSNKSKLSNRSFIKTKSNQISIKRDKFRDGSNIMGNNSTTGSNPIFLNSKSDSNLKQNSSSNIAKNYSKSNRNEDYFMDTRMGINKNNSMGTGSPNNNYERRYNYKRKRESSSKSSSNSNSDSNISSRSNSFERENNKSNAGIITGEKKNSGNSNNLLNNCNINPYDKRRKTFTNTTNSIRSNYYNTSNTAYYKKNYDKGDCSKGNYFRYKKNNFNRNKYDNEEKNSRKNYSIKFGHRPFRNRFEYDNRYNKRSNYSDHSDSSSFSNTYDLLKEFLSIKKSKDMKISELNLNLEEKNNDNFNGNNTIHEQPVQVFSSLKKPNFN